MARKAIVDRETVLQLLREGKTSQSIASQFGVSRQAIDLHRKEFVRTGVLTAARVPREPAPVKTPPQTPSPLPVTTAPVRTPKAENISLDQMIDILIRSLAAMKRLPELENEVAVLRQRHEAAIAKITELEERERKRLDQETQWQEAQKSLQRTNI